MRCVCVCLWLSSVKKFPLCLPLQTFFHLFYYYSMAGKGFCVGFCQVQLGWSRNSSWGEEEQANFTGWTPYLHGNMSAINNTRKRNGIQHQRFQSCKYHSWCLKAAGKFTWEKQTPLLRGQCFDWTGTVRQFLICVNGEASFVCVQSHWFPAHNVLFKLH